MASSPLSSPPRSPRSKLASPESTTAAESSIGPPQIPGLPSNSPLINSYTHHSPTPSASGPYICGIDEAGRGPVLGPLVYGIAYCPVAYRSDLENLGFADSKTLSHASRETLLGTLSSDPANLGWSVRVLSPQDISKGMLRRPPINLNAQSENATVLLIREIVAAGLEIAEVYVDALGPIGPYQAYLSSIFPTMSITVKAKADSIYPIVGAASIAAKVTRDTWMDGWIYEEPVYPPSSSGEKLTNDGITNASSSLPLPEWVDAPRGSGYPSDPKTQAFLKNSLEPTFGFPSLARFSWQTVKTALEKDGHAVKWTDEGQTNLIKAFESVGPREKGRSGLAKAFALKSVTDI